MPLADVESAFNTYLIYTRGKVSYFWAAMPFIRALVPFLFFASGVLSFAVSSCKSNDPAKLPAAVDTLRVLSLNILYGGDEINFDKVIESIQRSGADVVGIQEAEGRIPVLAKAAGWPYYNPQHHLLSKYPILAIEEGGWQYVYIQIRPGAVVALSNIHLPSDEYGPEAIRDGIAPDSVLKMEMRVRYPGLATHRKVLPPLFQTHKIPVFLTGDFNVPSHRDWTAASVGKRFHLKYPFEWPVSKNLEALGFTDAYRSVFPDPVQKPGLTWTPGYPPPHFKENETHDRIDFVWVAGAVKVLDCKIIGEENGPDVDVGIQPYGSDHRGVMAIAQANAVAPPDYIAPALRLIGESETATLYYGAKNRIPAEIRIQGLLDTVIRLNPSVSYGSVALSNPLKAGKYEISLSDKEGNQLAKNHFWVAAAEAKPEIWLDKSSFAYGEPIVVHWKNTPANKFDWIAIYEKGKAPSLEDYAYFAYQYTRGEVAGTLQIDKNAFGNFSSLKPGQYSAHFLVDDSYTSSFSVDFQIVQ